MANKSSTSQNDSVVNGHHNRIGDAAEPENVTSDDTSFDPALLGADIPEQPEQETGPDPFNPESLRITEESIASLGVTEQVTSLRCRKPGNAEFVRVHTDPTYSLYTHVIELKEDRELYLVAPSLWPRLVGEATFSPRSLFTAINRQGEVFIWPCRYPKPDGKQPDWITIPLEAVKFAKEKWTKIAWDESLRKHRIHTAAGQLGEPKWPSLSFREILKLTFKDAMIESEDHPILRKLRGEI